MAGKVVQATGNAGATDGLYTAKDIERAMAEAVEAAHREGVTDQTAVRDRMMKARKHFKDSKRGRA
jgi:spore cortex formation protein SpoVR/YcgB (stage V sporulation)